MEVANLSGEGTRRLAELQLTGAGMHRLKARTWNANVMGMEEILTLNSSPQKLDLAIDVEDPTKPWFVRICSEEAPDSYALLTGK